MSSVLGGAMSMMTTAVPEPTAAEAGGLPRRLSVISEANYNSADELEVVVSFCGCLRVCFCDYHLTIALFVSSCPRASLLFVLCQHVQFFSLCVYQTRDL